MVHDFSEGLRRRKVPCRVAAALVCLPKVAPPSTQDEFRLNCHIDMSIQGSRSELNRHDEVNGAGDSNAWTETECLDGSIWVKMA
jgi:hypothetical protein